MVVNNSQRILKNLVSIEAWHKELETVNQISPLTVDLVFQEALFGDNSTDKVRFRVRLKKAELVIKLDQSGNLVVPNDSVRRDAMSLKGRTVQALSTSSQNELKGHAEASISESGFNAKLNAKAASEIVRSESTLTDFEIEHGSISKEHFKEDGNHCWRFEPLVSELLYGNAWDGPAKLLELKTKYPSQIGDAVIVEVKCRREDIEVLDVESQNGHVWRLIPKTQKEKLALIHEIVRDELSELNLGDPDLENDFAQVTVASIVAVSE